MREYGRAVFVKVCELCGIKLDGTRGTDGKKFKEQWGIMANRRLRVIRGINHGICVWGIV